jgi:hypothetical protein
MKKIDFSCFLVLKTGKLSNFTGLGLIFCSANFRWDSPMFPKSTGLGLLIYIIGAGGQIRSENSALKVKSTKNSSKNGGNQNLRENCPRIKFSHCGSKPTFWLKTILPR